MGALDAAFGGPAGATTAIRTKSPKHAELFLRTMGALDAAFGGPAGATNINNGFVINNLVPRPEPMALPAAASVPALPPKAIPTVNVR